MKANGSTLYFTPSDSQLDILVDDSGTFTIFNNGDIGFTPLDCSALYVVTPIKADVSQLSHSRRLNRRQNYRSNFSIALTLVDKCNRLVDADLHPSLACREQVFQIAGDPRSGLSGSPDGSVSIASTEFVEIGTSFYTGSCVVPGADSIPGCDSLVDAVKTSFDTLQAAIKAAYLDKVPILSAIASPEGAFCGALVAAGLVASGGAAAVFPTLGAAFGVTASTGLCTKAIDGLINLSGLDRDTFCTNLRSALNLPVTVQVDGLDSAGPRIIATVTGVNPADISATLTVTSLDCSTSKFTTVTTETASGTVFTSTVVSPSPSRPIYGPTSTSPVNNDGEFTFSVGMSVVNFCVDYCPPIAQCPDGSSDYLTSDGFASARDCECSISNMFICLGTCPATSVRCSTDESR